MLLRGPQDGFFLQALSMTSESLYQTQYGILIQNLPEVLSDTHVRLLTSACETSGTVVEATPDHGACALYFSTAEEADAAVAGMDGRDFFGRLLKAQRAPDKRIDPTDSAEPLPLPEAPTNVEQVCVLVSGTPEDSGVCTLSVSRQTNGTGEHSLGLMLGLQRPIRAF